MILSNRFEKARKRLLELQSMAPTSNAALLRQQWIDYIINHKAIIADALLIASEKEPKKAIRETPVKCAMSGKEYVMLSKGDD